MYMKIILKRCILVQKMNKLLQNCYGNTVRMYLKEKRVKLWGDKALSTGKNALDMFWFI